MRYSPYPTRSACRSRLAADPQQVGVHAVLIGVVTAGWYKGHLVEGEYTMGTCAHDGVTTTCFAGSLDIMQALQP